MGKEILTSGNIEIEKKKKKIIVTRPLFFWDNYIFKNY